MTEACTNFNPQIWKQHICRNCFKTRENHPSYTTSNEIENIDVQSSTSHQRDNDEQDDLSQITEQNLLSSIREMPQTILPPCRYGLQCYRKNPEHFKNYSHPAEHERNKHMSKPDDLTTSTIHNDDERFSSPITHPRRKNKLKKKDEELEFINQMERHVLALHSELKLKGQKIEKLEQDQIEMRLYNQSLEQIIADDSEMHERRELEQKHSITIPKRPPSYWGSNAFSQSYREIQISNESPEFRIINDLMNSTIATHDNHYGTIYGRDPTEFIITEIKRIQNIDLWNEYCFKKDSIIRKNHNRVAQAGCSIHFGDHPLLMPLLDSQSNEYWLFHGCSHDVLHNLSHAGYDPRVSNLKGMFGGGFYLAENSSKSNQYIPCPGCNGNAIATSMGCTCPNQRDFIFMMVLYRVILGDVHVALQYDREKYCKGVEKGKYVRRPPIKTSTTDLYDSVMGESIRHGGNRLQYREFVLYERGQAYPEYVINFRRSVENVHPPTDMDRLLNRCQNFLKNTFRSVPE
ncbi:unnamed protein product [Adineta steineri]|uniref:Poly [ADP-ribose] polymerase n=1 Tax=Adineta steineri TaxID=433720 RepID=A0A815T791_9BILA|nr:unnamed protein product [Adineta steineri]